MNKKILIVDDDSNYREMLRFCLEQKDYSVVEATNGHEALSRVGEVNPDLILMDLKMPLKNGYEVLQELKASMMTRQIPVVIISGSPFLRDKQFLHLDTAAMLNKTVTADELLGVVEKVVHGKSAMSFSQMQTTIPEPPPIDPDADSEWAANETSESLELEFGKPEDAKPQVNTHQLEILANDAPVIKLINQIFIQACRTNASDIHIEPQETQVDIRFRQDGILRSVRKLPLNIHPQISGRLKIISGMVVTERRLPQDGQFQAVMAGKKIEFRINAVPCLYGEKFVIRLLGQGKVKPDLKGLEFSERDLDQVERALGAPHGMILVTGPTGSGKTTTLYTMINVLNNEDINIMTAEDPVEYRLPGISQVQVKASIGLTFSQVLRAFLRQDPDMILVGEIRDAETAEIASKASITGHLVLSTLHTNSAPATVTRLINMGLAPYMVAASLKLVVAQRLIRLLCTACRKKTVLSTHEKKILRKEEAEQLQEVWAPVGCSACQNIGYKGRKPVFEVMPISSVQMKEKIAESATAESLNQQAVSEGMTSLRHAAVLCAASGDTSMEEALKIVLAD